MAWDRHATACCHGCGAAAMQHNDDVAAVLHVAATVRQRREGCRCRCPQLMAGVTFTEAAGQRCAGSGSGQAVGRQGSGSVHAVGRQWAGSGQAGVRQGSGSGQAVGRQGSGSVHAVGRQWAGSGQAGVRQWAGSGQRCVGSGMIGEERRLGEACVSGARKRMHGQATWHAFQERTTGYTGDGT
eukprot:365086-Chlamydomonas_euryale.AAC.3